MSQGLKAFSLGLAAAAGFVTVVAMSGGGALARPLTPAEERHQPYDGVLPVCQDPAVLQRIARRLHQREEEYWSSGLEIVAYDKIRETGYRSNGIDYIPRRYCSASAIMNDGKVRRVSYSIGENLGIIGWGWGVEWCIAGLDRNLAWGAACRVATP